MSDNWDIESHRTEHETDEHWELKKKFMLAHKDKFPEDELVCLAQVFVNIEFMGCRYPDKTMIRVAELAKGIVEKYRDEKKNSLKRTFVAASDAASAKVKGNSSIYMRLEEGAAHLNDRRFVKGEEEGPPKKKIKSNEKKKFESDLDSSFNKKEFGSGNLNKKTPKYGGVKTFDINPSVTNKSSLENFVLILDSDEHPVSTIQRSASVNKCLTKWEFEEGAGSLKVCKFYLNNEFISMGVGVNMKSSKENTAMAAIKKLKELCYGIKIKMKFSSETTINSSQIGGSASENNYSKALGEDNIGRKLMKLMGWQGGGLGSQQQGIEEPVGAALQVGREGFGHHKNNANLVDFKKKAREYIRAWMKSDSEQDLVFSTEFNSDERKAMHEIASSFSLKSKSYGKDANRQLVISRKSEPWEIVQELKKSGGSSDKYELLFPTKN